MAGSASVGTTAFLLKAGVEVVGLPECNQFCTLGVYPVF